MRIDSLFIGISKIPLILSVAIALWASIKCKKAASLRFCRLDKKFVRILG